MTSIDHEDNKLDPCVPVTIRDLREEEDVRDILKMLPNAGYVHMAPPCGTFSRARDIGSYGLRPLRNAEHVEGIPGLTGTDLARVQSANAVTNAIMRIMRACIRLEVPFTVENPTRSWIWQYRAMPNLISRLHVYDCHMCMHGGLRKKATRLVSNSPDFKGMRRLCDGSHEHLSWKPVNGEFVTAAEAVYPAAFCKKLTALAEHAEASR